MNLKARIVEGANRRWTQIDGDPGSVRRLTFRVSLDSGADLLQTRCHQRPSASVCGWNSGFQGERHAFLWEDGAMMDLDSVLTAGSGWVLNWPKPSNVRGCSFNGRIPQSRGPVLMTPRHS